MEICGDLMNIEKTDTLLEQAVQPESLEEENKHDRYKELH
jgi:hypothetical protein